MLVAVLLLLLLFGVVWCGVVWEVESPSQVGFQVASYSLCMPASILSQIGVVAKGDLIGWESLLTPKQSRGQKKGSRPLSEGTVPPTFRAVWHPGPTEKASGDPAVLAAPADCLCGIRSCMWCHMRGLGPCKGSHQLEAKC